MLADRRGEVKGGVREGIEGVDVATFELATLSIKSVFIRIMMNN